MALGMKLHAYMGNNNQKRHKNELKEWRSHVKQNTAAAPIAQSGRTAIIKANEI